MAFIEADDAVIDVTPKAMKPATLSFRYGTSIMPTVVKGIIGTLPPHLKEIVASNRIYDEEVIEEFAENLLFPQRRGRHLELEGRYPSVSALLGAAEDDLTKLYNWQSRMIKEMGFQGFTKHMAKRTSSGTNFHKTVEYMLKELQEKGSISDKCFEKAINEVSAEENRKYIESIIPVIKEIPKTDYMKLEKATKNHWCLYQGRFDAIVEIEGKPTLIDWKTVSAESYKHSKVNDLARLYGVPLQVLAYIAAVNSDPDYSAMPQIRQGAVVLAYEDGRKAEIILVKDDDLKERTRIFAKKLLQFWRKMLYPEKGQKDRSGNINFVFNPALIKPQSNDESNITDKPEVIVLDEEVIVEDENPSSQRGEDKGKSPQKPKYFPMFEKQSKNVKAAGTGSADPSAYKKAVFGL